MRAQKTFVMMFFLACGGGYSASPIDFGAEEVLTLDTLVTDEVSLDAEPVELMDFVSADEAKLPEAVPDAEVVPQDVLDLVAEGKRWLRDGEPAYARKAFEQALALAPDYTDALFGLALSHLVYGAELSVMAVSIGGQLGDPGAYAAFKPFPPDSWSQNEYLASEFHYIFMNLRKHFVLASELLDRIKGRPLSFDVEAVPVSLGIKPTLIYRGVFDKGDVHLMKAVADFAAAFFDVLAGQDLSTDLLTIVGLVKSGFDDLSGRIIFATIAYLLNEGPNFLTLHPKDGETLFFDARERFASVGAEVSAAVQAMQEEETTGEGVSYWEADLSGGGKLHICCRIRRGLEDSSYEEEMLFALSPEILNAFEEASRSIKTPGYKVTLHGAVIPILAAILSAAAQSGLLEGLQISLPIDIGAFEVPQLSGLLSVFLPNVFAFDWGAFFEQPVGLRAWLPEVTNRGLGGLTDTVIAEWECPDDLDQYGFPTGLLGLFCNRNAVLKDSAHFLGTDFEIAADSIASPVPVLAFKDPMLNNLVYVDLQAPSNQVAATSYEPATLLTLNAALAKILGGLIMLLPAD